jgi:hypothetical protein
MTERDILRFWDGGSLTDMAIFERKDRSLILAPKTFLFSLVSKLRTIGISS